MPFLVNPHAQRGAYPPALQALLDLGRGRECRRWLAAWPLLAPGPTPTWPLPALARRLGVATVSVKDESARAPLGSFKALGAPVALVRLVLRRFPGRGWSAASLFAGAQADALRELVVVAATDGNHGRALAAAARSLGCGCVIVLHAQVSTEREAAIAAYGARIVRIGGGYDDSVREAAALAARHGWEPVSDTSWDGYEEVPRDVMQGYAVLADEVLDGLPDGAPCPFTHVMLQGGVGGLAAGVASHLWQRFGAARPRIVVVEPRQADCLWQSALAGRPARAGGSVDSLMAGLACGEASPLAWRVLQPAVDLFVTVDDDEAAAVMRERATPVDGDLPLVAGESGAAGLAALQQLAGSAAGRAAAALDGHSRVLCFNTEGATAPAVYEAVVGRPADAVVQAQRERLAGCT